MLVNDAPDNGLLPDTLYLSDGSIAPVSTASNIVVNGALSAGNLLVTVGANAPSGWTYLRFEDPGNGQYRLAHVRSADNSEIARRTYSWTTDRIFPGGEPRATRTNPVPAPDIHRPGTHSV